MNSETKTVRTTCSYCGVGCGMEVTRDRAGRLHLRGDEAHPVNRGMLCSKGQALHHVVQDHSDRLLYPQMRASRAHPMMRVDWDTAIARAAGVFRATIDRYGPESVGFYVSGQCLTEEYYIVNKLVKGFIGCNNIDTNSRLCMSSAVAGYKLALGDDVFPLSYDDIEQCECFLIAGANPAWCHPILFRRLEQHRERNPDTKVIVVDPRRTQTCTIADLHLQIAPGTDVAAYNAIARVLIEKDWVDRAFIDAHTEGWEAMKAAAFSLPVDEAARVCDVPVADIHEAARLIGTAATFQSWWAMGLNQSSMGVDKNVALLNLSLVTGQIGKPGSGPFSLTGQPNAMGGREVGGMANLLAAHHDLANPAHREKVSRFWGGKAISEKPGLTATEMIGALASGKLRALWVICTNPAVSLPNLGAVEKAFDNARFLVVQDISQHSETTRFADLILPAAGWLEKIGTMTNSERRVSLLEKLVEPPGEALPDVEILCRFARKMGWSGAFSYADESKIFDEHAALTKGTAIDITGLNYARLRAEGTIQWPCPETDHPGTPRLFADGSFCTPSGRARLHGAAFSNASEATSESCPLVLTTGRIRDQWHTMTRTGTVRKLRTQQDEPFVEVHPNDAKRLGLHDGKPARIFNDRGSVEAIVHVSANIKRGVLFMPMHFGRAFHSGKGRVNALTSPQVDARSKEPDFKYAAVTAAPLAEKTRRVVVIGAGAAALHFVETLRAGNRRDAITVLGREPHPFYNRIQLPDYVNGARSWGELITCGAERLGALDVQFENKVTVARIDRAKRTIHDNAGHVWHYDVLVLATGSRAAMPKDAPHHLNGVHTLRNRCDADAIRSRAMRKRETIIVGGGLLGIELASALANLGTPVTLLHRSGRLMSAQLDDRASELLLEELRDRNIDVILNDGILHAHGEKSVEFVRTTGGRYLPCGMLVYAVGTTPNVSLAKDARLACGTGVLVDDTLRTNDPAIYAIGEVAEHRGERYGTTLGAQQQAETAARHLNGDPWASYRGSIALNLLKVKGLALAAIGNTSVPHNAGSQYEQVTFLDEGERTYLKCVVRQDRLVGALLMGDTTMLAHYRQLIESGTELDAERAKLLRPGAGKLPDPVRGKLVCSCNSVGEENIADAIAGGCGNLDAVCVKTTAGLGCGSCRPEITQLLDRAKRAVGAA